MKQVKDNQNISYELQCEITGLSYSTFKKWKKRQGQGDPVIRAPGPKKVGPLNVEHLMDDIRLLSHGHKRTKGTGALYETYRDVISRRDFASQVEQVRREVRADKDARAKRIKWKMPNLVWAVDDTELTGSAWPFGGQRTFLHNIQDLASTYKLLPVAGTFTCGEEVAGNLHRLFEEHGAPLFLKRDNGGNLNHMAVNELLSDYMVLPLNSPNHYPPYNGGIEKAQQEIQRGLLNKLAGSSGNIREYLQPYAETTVHDINHIRRDILEGKNACEVFFSMDNRVTFNRRERKEIADELKQKTAAILAGMAVQGANAEQAAWRIVVEQWLERQGFITITRKKQVLPSFNEKKGS